MEKILSIVIPSYNTAKYMNKNLPTLLDDRILKDVEILIISKGSTDDTLEVANKYALLYPDTVKVIDLEDHNDKTYVRYGSIVNKGITLSTGKYIKTIDGDDWVITENFVRLVYFLKTCEADLVINPFHFVYEKSYISKLVNFDAKDPGIKVLFDDVCGQYQKLPIHSICYKTSVLQNNKVTIRENCFYVDNEYDLFPIPFVDTICINDYPVYQYLVAQKGQSISDNNALKNHEMFYNVLIDCINNYNNNECTLSISKKLYYQKTICELVRTQYMTYLRSGFKNDAYKKFCWFYYDFYNSYKYFFEESIKKYYYLKFIKPNKMITYAVFSLLVKGYRKVKKL